MNTDVNGNVSGHYTIYEIPQEIYELWSKYDSYIPDHYDFDWSMFLCISNKTESYDI